VRLLGQRWEYRIGNSIVLVDNAFSWAGWGQERLLVNDETVASAGGVFGLYRGFSEPWLTRLGESELQVALSSRLRGIACAVTVDGEPVTPKAFWTAAWSGPPGRLAGRGRMAGSTRTAMDRAVALCLLRGAL
jgi:hypothetical protein